jgi:hypothetical protein
LIPGLKDMTYENRLRKLKLPTLAYRRKRGDMIEVFKLTSGLYDTALLSAKLNWHTQDEVVLVLCIT